MSETVEKKYPTFLQIIRFWSVFSVKEKIVFVLLGLTAIIAFAISAKIFFSRYIIEIPEAGGDYTEGVLEEIHYINPILASNETERSIANLIFRGILQYDISGKLVPDLAETFAVSEDGKRYAITLKKDVVWHDGKPVTADDVIFTIAMAQNPDFRSPLRANWQGVVMEKIDQHSLVLNLRQAYAPFAENLTIGIIPKHAWTVIRPENSLQAEFNLKPIGSGFYKFKKLTRAFNGIITSYTVERHGQKDDNEPPYLDTITFQTFGSEETTLSSYQRGRIDGMNFISAENIDKVQKQNEVYKLSLPQIFAVFFNQSKNKFLSEAALREALELALDKNELIKTVFRGNALAITSLFPPGSMGYRETLPVAKKDIARAKKMLDAAGWGENPDTHIREKKFPKSKTTPEKTESLRIALITSAWPDLAETAKFLSEAWKEIGVETTVETFAVPELEHKFIRARNYEALLFGENYSRSTDPFAFWHSTQARHPGLNLALYANKKADALMETARRSKSDMEIKTKYEELQSLIIKDRPAIFLYTPNYFFVVRSNMRGVDINTITKPSDRFVFAAQWYMNTDWAFK